MWASLITTLVNAGWYVLYGGLMILGIFVISVIVKCTCGAMETRICAEQIEKADELVVLEKLINFHTKGQRCSKTRRNSISGEQLLREIVNQGRGKR